MTIIRRCSIALPVLCWQLVNIAVFGYACAFLFWPTDVSKLFIVAPDPELVRFMGVLFLFSAAGTNQMLAHSIGGTALMKKSSYAASLIEYLFGGVAGIVVLSMKEEPFIKEQRFAFIILFSLFVSALTLALFCSCGGKITLSSVGEETVLKSVEVDSVVSRSRSIPKSRAEILSAAR